MFYFAVLNLECRASHTRKALGCWSAYYTLLAFWTSFPITSSTAVVERLRESLWCQEQLCGESSISQFTAPISRVSKHIWFSNRGHHRLNSRFLLSPEVSVPPHLWAEISITSWRAFYSSREHPFSPILFPPVSSQWLSHWLEPQAMLSRALLLISNG